MATSHRRQSLAHDADVHMLCQLLWTLKTRTRTVKADFAECEHSQDQQDRSSLPAGRLGKIHNPCSATVGDGPIRPFREPCRRRWGSGGVWRHNRAAPIAVNRHRRFQGAGATRAGPASREGPRRLSALERGIRGRTATAAEPRDSHAARPRSGPSSGPFRHGASESPSRTCTSVDSDPARRPVGRGTPPRGRRD